ncbi:MAG: phage tail family protein [Oscillospiraceae bacterium]|nr:phage tail family protein [Oscillospiraceae bacterium]
MVRNLEWHAANGDVIKFSHSKPFLLERFYPGTPGASAEIVKAIRIAGQKTYHVNAEPLTPSMTGSMHAKSQKELDNLRRRLQAALNPLHFGLLIYNNHAGSFRLQCRPLTGAEISARIGSAHKIDIEWISDEAYWTAQAESKLNVGERKKSWRFPWVIKPTVFCQIMNKGYIHNPTQISVMPVISISQTESEKVTIGNSSISAYTTITQKIAPEERLELDMSIPSARLICSDGSAQDVTHWITLDSTFPWALLPGENEIYADADNPDMTPIITLRWRLPEVGI